MSALLHTLMLLLSVVLAYVWLQIPALRPYSLQVFALSMIVYLVIKRLKKHQLWHLGPGSMSLEMSLITFAFLLVIGFTGNTQSLFFPLSYIHLFFLVFAAELSTALILTLAILLFHYSLVPDFSVRDISMLASLPILLFFFIFAKAQYYQNQEEKSLLEKEEGDLWQTTTNQSGLLSFLTGFLQPRLDQVLKLLDFPAQNQQLLQSQVMLIQVEIHKLLAKMNAPTPVATETSTEVPTTVEPISSDVSTPPSTSALDTEIPLAEDVDTNVTST